jgi:hypothetical protein
MPQCFRHIAWYFFSSLWIMAGPVTCMETGISEIGFTVIKDKKRIVKLFEVYKYMIHLLRMAFSRGYHIMGKVKKLEC